MFYNYKAHWQKAKHDFAEWCDTAEEWDELFSESYLLLCYDKNVEHLIGTRGHFKAMFQEIKGDCDDGSDDHTSLGRWLQWFRRYPSLDSKWHTKLMLYCYQLAKRGVDLKKIPWAGSTHIPIKHFKLGNKTVGSTPASELAAKHVNSLPLEQAEDAPSTDMSTLEKAASLLADHSRQRLCRVLLLAVKPMHQAFATTQTNLKGPESVLKYHIGFALGAYDSVLRKCMSRLSDMSVLQQLPLQMAFTDDISSEDHPLRYQDKCLASKMCQLVVSLVSHQAKTHEVFKLLPPLCMAPMLGSLQQAADCMKLVERLCNAMYAAENVMYADREVHSVFLACCWPLQTSVREMFAYLRELNFSVAPQHVKDVLLCIFKSWGSTGVCENGFRGVRAAEKKSPSGTISNVRKWCTLHQDEEIARYERHEVSAMTADGGAEGCSKGLNKSFFQSWHATPTVPLKGDSGLRTIMGTLRWPSFTRASKIDTVAATSLLLRMSDEGEKWGLAKIAWQNCVPLTGWLLRQQGGDKVWVVLHSSAFRLLLWPCLTPPNSSTVFADTSNRASPSWESIDDITKWEAANAYTSAVAPADQWFAHAKRPAKKPSSHAIGVSTAGFERVLNASARVGFRGVEDAQLRKIGKLLNLDFDEMPLDKRPPHLIHYKHIQACTHESNYMHIQSYMQTFMHTLIHAYMHTHIPSHTQTYTHS